ncbi:hypothetical protein VAR608DRAFT_1690 [Variovorax sp. HW608]|uniref:hypothetical protein n=1 Tax=Variovorax sp. HW608 TaxID=1034889 RepID=UPI00081F8600|nr:hypothetical protein [Variovorax sp. HW608]SCK21888.1 hypothetical protein VAR608DRAFT_1690 [Variovorax sp. HW608]
MKQSSLPRWCATVLLSFCLTGCYTGKIEIGDPQWKFSMRPAANCKSIDGRYIDNDLLLRQFQDPYFPPRPPGEERYSNGVQLISTPHEAMQPKMIAEVRKIDQIWQIQMIGKEGEIYSNTSLAMNHPDVGCDDNGNLVLRSFRALWGAELSGGSAFASERRFRKLADESLEVSRLDREWKSSMNRSPDRSTETILIFPSAR